jgi:hypothetical protein
MRFFPLRSDIDEPVVTILSAGVGGLGLYLYLR